MPGPMDDPRDMRRFSDALRRATEDKMVALADRLTSGELTVAEWTEEMKLLLRKGNLYQFVTSKGGDRTRIKRTEYLKLGTELNRQYRYLYRFANDIVQRAEEGRSLGFVANRARLYARSTQAMFYRGAIPVDLPQYPRDGKTRCRNNCKCRLEYETVRGEEGQPIAINVFWKLGIAEHCPDCIQLSREWKPYTVALTEETARGISSREQGIALLLSENEDWINDRDVLEEMLGINQAIYMELEV